MACSEILREIRGAMVRVGSQKHRNEGSMNFLRVFRGPLMFRVWMPPVFQNPICHIGVHFTRRHRCELESSGAILGDGEI